MTDLDRHPVIDTVALAAAYEGVESAEGFPDRSSLEQYRENLLAKSALQADFIMSRHAQAQSVFEACCGNGRLLVALARSLERASGFDIAESRIAFAEKWLSDLGLDHVSVWRDDILNLEPATSEAADIVLCITGAFAYFEPLAADAADVAAAALASRCTPGAGLILEIYQHPSEIRECKARADRTVHTWKELPASDPFRYFLSKYQFDEDSSFLSHAKTFIGRDGQIDAGRVEVLRVYAPEEIEALFAPWFEKFEFFRDWRGTPWSETSSSMIATATRRNQG